MKNGSMQIVWFSEIKWDYLKTRKQQIITRKPENVQLLFLEPYAKGRRNRFRLRREANIFCATIPFIKAIPYVPLRAVLDHRSARAAVDLVARVRIRRLMKEMQFDADAVGFIISNIYAADIASILPKKFLLYDCNDDHSSFPGMRSWSQTYFYRTSRNADAVFASSRALLDKITDVRGGSDSCYYLGNGVDFVHFRNGAAPTPIRPDEKPRLGYIGALAPWIDFDAIADLARKRPDWEIILIGPILHRTEAELMRVTALPNVFHLAAVPYDRLPATLSQFNLGLIPFRYNELTRGVNPNKLYEYLAAGLPVVTTKFSDEVLKFPDVVKAVDPGDDFIDACSRTLDELGDPGRAAEIADRARKIAQANDWNVISGSFWKKVEELMLM